MANSSRIARSQSGPRPPVPRPSALTTAKPWSAIHWASQPALRAVHDLAVVRAAVRAHQHRQRGARHVVAGAARRRPRGRGRRPGRRRAGAAAAASRRTTSPGGARARCGGPTTVAGSPAATLATTTEPPATGADVHAARPGQPLDAGTGRPPPQVLLRSGRRCRATRTPSSPTDSTDVDLDRGAGDRLAVDHEPAGAVEVGGRHQATVGQQGRHAGHDVQPDRVATARASSVVAAGRRVDRAAPAARRWSRDITCTTAPAGDPGGAR